MEGKEEMNRLFNMTNKGRGTWMVAAPDEATAIVYSFNILRRARKMQNISVLNDVTDKYYSEDGDFLDKILGHNYAGHVIRASHSYTIQEILDGVTSLPGHTWYLEYAVEHSDSRLDPNWRNRCIN